MTQRREYNEDDRVTVGFKAWAKHAHYVHQAAEKAGVSTAKYLEHVVLNWAASDLGLPPEALAEPKPRPDTIPPPRLSAAEAMANLQAAVEAARAVLEAAEPEIPRAPRKASGTMRRVG